MRNSRLRELCCSSGATSWEVLSLAAHTTPPIISAFDILSMSFLLFFVVLGHGRKKHKRHPA